MEGPQIFQPENPENTVETLESLFDKILEEIFAKGPEDPEVQSMIGTWYDGMDIAVGKDMEKRSQYEIQKVDLYIAGGYMEDARKALTSAVLFLNGQEVVDSDDIELNIPSGFEERRETLGMASFKAEIEAMRDVALDEAREKSNDL